MIFGKNREKIVKNGLSLAKIKLLQEKSPPFGTCAGKIFKKIMMKTPKKVKNHPAFTSELFPKKHVFELKS